jgi:hypothetical protein
MTYLDFRPMVAKILRERKAKRKAKPVDPAWLEAFNHARAQGLNVDAFTFQIAWAYATQEQP